MHTAPDYALPDGTRLRGDDYIIDAFLGQGGFGITYRAEDRTLRRTVAVKEFFPLGCGRTGMYLTPGGGWTAQDLEDHRSRFVEEGRVLARLRNVGIVQIYGIFEENGTAYLVMEFIEGLTLEEHLISMGGWLREMEATEVIRRVGQALSEVHAESLLHRDLKPANLMRRVDGQIVLIDFGAARDFLPDTIFSQTVILTHGYAPLEQYTRQGKRGPFTDVYALAATLYHMLTGRAPTGATDRVVGSQLIPPREVRDDISRVVSDAVMAGMQLHGVDRPQSVDAFLALLADSAVRPVVFHPPRRVKPSILKIVLIGLLILSILSAIWMLPFLTVNRQLKQSHPTRIRSRDTAQPDHIKPDWDVSSHKRRLYAVGG